MVYIGIDIGGTDVKIGLLDEDANILAQGKTPTGVGGSYQDMIGNMADYALKLLSQIGYTLDDVAAVGVGVPGVASNITGVVMRCVNMQWWNIPLREEMQKHIPKPIVIDNDANLAGFAESICGVSADTGSSVFITLGTGVGGGLIINGRPWSGHHSAGGEIGHIIMQIDGEPCTCGRRGCVERYCSATALIRLAKEAAIEHHESTLWSVSDNNLEKLNGKNIFACAMAGDETAVAVFDRYIHYLCLALSSIICLLDPQVIVIGGGLSKDGPFLLNAIQSRIKGYLAFPEVPYAEIKIATLGANAGFIGAALLAKQMLEETV
ncbi:MAG TPA: ROK family protein [Candidatus Limiplasma sp.]|nr:ROK family protein [Candidatus Limiplasma sp.]HRX08483.1 ROK family protein [Candidatus Limiplasma sp.]